MNQNLTDITVVLDRSGSMSIIKKDVEGGYNTFITDQKKQPGQANVTLVQFDSISETVYTAKSIQDVPDLNLVPRNSTALLDTLAETIDSTGQRLAAMPEHERPGKVIFVIITDGEENASHKYKRSDVFDRIKKQTEQYSWAFMYIGANQDAIGEAASIGIARGQTLNFCASSAGTKGMSNYLARSVGSYRMSGDMDDLKATDAEVACAAAE